MKSMIRVERPTSTFPNIDSMSLLASPWSNKGWPSLQLINFVKVTLQCTNSAGHLTDLTHAPGLVQSNANSALNS